ncbi:CaiB/BaiF CoA transferase family protein [Pseudothauera rhizosphaerae]|uniref:CoA transferase n=1 Tax=Pseudothauera rhizosphaerae TaxID=2565932 RepID=A0A4S4AM24_9RHOO|nr:CaiB/BaiF CoA-transferase family protein [Pseudothauera rhizosphaerae]THF60515.1 CoA transferase [Pseudothauera rhizosphaerae]
MSGGPLAGVRVLDLSRILAGPNCAQLLGDLGAEVIKVEKPGEGDDTRRWGPPFVRDRHGKPTGESAYYLCANRNKRSIAVDLSRPEGQSLVRRLAARSDVLIENYKVGTLGRYGLDYASLHETLPGLIYCSITGFGQTGPYATRSGYDFLIQGMGGIMSLTGEPDGPPMKTGVGIADVMTGMYAAVAILAALRHKEHTGEGQHIDLALFDTQLAWLVNAGTNYLLSGRDQPRLGNAHPNIVPYEVFPARGGHFILAVGNDGQFRRLCGLLERPGLADDPRYATNPARLEHRDTLIPLLKDLTRRRERSHWLGQCEALGIPAGPVNTVSEAFADPQARFRGARVDLADEEVEGGSVPLVANPIRLNATPVTYRRAPPRLGAHSREILAEVLELPPQEIDALIAAGVVAEGA